MRFFIFLFDATLVLLILWVVVNIWRKAYLEGEKDSKKGVINMIKYPYTTTMVLVGLIIFILVLTFGSFTTVDAGEVGIIKRFGRITGRALEPGFHFKVPFADHVLKYDTKLVVYETRRNPEQYDKTYDEDASVYLDYPVDTNTKDGQQVNVFFTVRFSVDPTKAAEIAQNIGSEDAMVGKIVKTESRIWARNIPREYDAASLYSGDVVQVQQGIFDRLQPVFAQNGIILDEVGIREIEFTDQYVSAIETKQIEAVKIETEQNKAEQAKFEKERRITQAEASAEEQRLQQATLGQEVLEKLLLDKWDGKYPDTLILGDTGQFILPLPKNE